MRVVLVAHDADAFAVLHATCVGAGHQPVAYVHARSARPRSPVGAVSGKAVAEVVEAMPPGMDLLLPGSGTGMAEALSGYRPDLVVCHGFPWRIPGAALRIPRLGMLNIHPSLLPRHRGPMPIHWAIRSGDPEIGVTIHWMDETFDSGRIMAQAGGIQLPDDMDDTAADGVIAQVDAVIRGLLPLALERAAAGWPGEPQNELAATYEGAMGPEFSAVDWSADARDIHNLVRTFRFGYFATPGPVAEVNGEWVALLRTRMEPADGIRVECGDGPIWIVESVPASAPPGVAEPAAP